MSEINESPGDGSIAQLFRFGLLKLMEQSQHGAIVDVHDTYIHGKHASRNDLIT